MEYLLNDHENFIVAVDTAKDAKLHLVHMIMEETGQSLKKD